MTTWVAEIPASTAGRRGSRLALWAGASVVFHAGLLALTLLWQPSELTPAEAPYNLIHVDIEPVVLPRAVPARNPVATTPVTGPSTASAQASSDRSRTQTPDMAPSPRRPAADTALATSSTTDSDRWSYRPETTASAVARATRLSPIGCAYPERLSEGERAICAERETDRAVRALERGVRITGSGDARRDRALETEGRARTNSYNFRRRPISNDETGNGRPSDTPGSNFGLGPSGRHLDPSTQPDAHGPIQTYRRDGRPEERNVTTPR